jgi:hypothetical protein
MEEERMIGGGAHEVLELAQRTSETGVFLTGLTVVVAVVLLVVAAVLLLRSRHG